MVRFLIEVSIMMVRCNSCGWVHVGVTTDFAQEAVRTFNAMYFHLTDEQREEYYHSHPAKLADYESCYKCGGSYLQMSVVDKNDTKTFAKVKGRTLQSVLRK